MTQQITIPIALLEQLVGALEEVSDYINRYAVPAHQLELDPIDVSITAGRAALDGAESVRCCRTYTQAETNAEVAAGALVQTGPLEWSTPQQSAMRKIGGRVNNKPPISKPTFSLQEVANIDSLVDLGIPQRKLGPKLGVHWRTVHAAYHRKGAYVSYPKPIQIPAQEVETECPQQDQQVQS